MTRWRAIAAALASALAVVVAALACVQGCSSTIKPAGGLMLVVTTDGTLNVTELQVAVTSTDGTKTYRSALYRIPDETTLPTSLGIASNGDPKAAVAITVNAFQNGQPLDVRQNEVYEIPADRVAELDIVLSAQCTPHAVLVGTQAQSNCPSGQTCDPTTGTCVSNVVNAGGLPTFGSDAGVVRDGGAVDATTPPVTDAATPVSASCADGAVGCLGQTPAACVSSAWQPTGSRCAGSTPYCVGASCVALPTSCATGSASNDCAGGCCQTDAIDGGTFHRSYDWDGAVLENQTAPATVSAFQLDKYDVTVGRFRAYVGYLQDGGAPPAVGSGKHSHLSGGRGVVDSTVTGAPAYETGWKAAWSGNITTSSAPAGTWDKNLACGTNETWTPSRGANEAMPINCLTWFEAYAFCIWDGGFLPTEAEWGFAASGGSEQRFYPWGATDPGTANLYAIYGDQYTWTIGDSGAPINVAPVGSAPFGAGKWGELDLAGNVYQWTLDWWVSSGFAGTCDDCANLATQGAVTSGFESARGSAYDQFVSPVNQITSFYDAYNAPPTARLEFIGVRCARSP